MSNYKDSIASCSKKRDKYGVSCSFVDPNWFVGEQTLYHLALDELGAKSCSDDQIFPAVFGNNHELVKTKCKNGYYAFDFCVHFLRLRAIGKSKDDALQSVFDKYRITWERYVDVDFRALIEHRLSEKQLVYYTASGLILFNNETNDFEPNPLFLSDEQHTTWAHPKMAWPAKIFG